MPTVISRQACGLKPARSRTPWTGPNPVGVTVHWNGSDLPKGDLEHSKNIVRGIQRTHFAKGYADIAYNFLVDHNGYVFEGRGYDVQSGAHSPGNEEHAAICLLVDKDEEPTVTQWESFLWLRDQWVALKGADELKAHNEWGGTSCPGDKITKRINDIRNGVSMGPGEITKDQIDYINILAYGSKPGAGYDYRHVGGTLHAFLVEVLGPDPLKNPNTFVAKVADGKLVPPGQDLDKEKLYNEQIAATKEVFGK
jgi:hypothetical protein